ncbi:MAG: D-tyrosyl-tRNA(Tyr) deacylase [Phycisphaerales bacterium]|nr:D-tyrosyl-tRNA(Tyr) deacylase [Phycisphaerales bacterium]
MIAVVQRASQASVTSDGAHCGALSARGGLCILLGVERTDTAEIADRFAEKLAKLRIFDDAAGKMNLSVRDVDGSALVVSQFTLVADTSGGNRPSFIEAAPPALAEPLVDRVVEQLRILGVPTETGRFQTTMQVSLVNDGPTTIILKL